MDLRPLATRSWNQLEIEKTKISGLDYDKYYCPTHETWNFAMG